MSAFASKFISAALAALLMSACSEGSFQSDADIYRFQDLEHYGNLIEAYKAKTGQYPFSDRVSDKPVYAVIASPEQIDDVQPLPFAHVEITTAEFFNEIERGIGTQVEERYDPQFEPDRKPNFYIYNMGADRYFFAVHLSQPYSFTQDVGPGYHKIEISNRPGNDSYAIRPDVLFQSPEFIEARDKTVSKPELFNQRRQDFADVHPTQLEMNPNSLRK